MSLLTLYLCCQLNPINPTYTVEVYCVVKHQYVCLSVSIELPKCSHTVKYINTLPSKHIEHWKPSCPTRMIEVLMSNLQIQWLTRAK